VFLFVPIFVVIVYSFNGGRVLYVWTSWSAKWYEAALNSPRSLDALMISVETALISAAVATLLGLLAGVTLARRAGFWRIPFGVLVLIVLGTPELVSAVGQMVLLDRLGIYDGLARISMAHSVFGAAVVTLIVRARAEGLGDVLEQAAADLGAPPWRAFFSVTLPLMFPAVVAGLLMAFTFSFDDVITSLFVQRPGSSTLPLYILSSMRAGLKGDVAALAVIMLAISVLGVTIAALMLRRLNLK